MESDPRRDDLSRGTRLTPREREVLEVMRDADSEADAAAILGLSRHTIHAHLRSTRDRLDVKTTRQAIARLQPPELVDELPPAT
jgi:DNA-binding CsgD family transcriptional regulator